MVYMCTPVATVPSFVAEVRSPEDAGGNEVLVSQFGMIRDSQHDGKSENKTVSNLMCDHMLVETFVQFESRIEGHCAHKVLNVLKKTKI